MTATIWSVRRILRCLLQKLNHLFSVVPGLVFCIEHANNSDNPGSMAINFGTQNRHMVETKWALHLLFIKKR